ncbi:autotransporter-associated beta strand repeat-containing protein, partial [Pseudoxanthobacter soli DSM 19599]
AGETIGSLAGAGSVSLTSLAQLNLGGDNTSTTFSGVISGSGGLDKAGSGTLTLSGANTLTGVVQVLAGGLVLSGGSRLPDTAEINLGTSANLELTGGSQSLKALNDAIATPGTATVQLNDNTLTLGEGNGTGSFSGTIAGTGGLTKVGSLNIVLSGTNTFTGPLQISEGKVFLQGGAALADSVAVTAASGAELVLQASETIGSLAGAGNVVGAGGAWILTTGGNNADTTFSGTLFGAGGSIGLVKTGTGTLTLTGDNTYTGGTTVSGGTLQIGAGGTTGSITGNVALSSNGAVVTFNRSNDLTFSGVISGTGQIRKQGAGTLTLSGQNTLTGVTNVDAGTLNLTGSVGGPLAVGYGGTLTGTGTVGGMLVIYDGGALAGTSGSTLTVTGNMVQGAASLFNATLGAPTTTAIVTAANLTLDGTLNITTGAGFASGTYRLIDYSGTLTDNGLAVGTVPAHSLYAVDTGTAGQVDL